MPDDDIPYGALYVACLVLVVLLGIVVMAWPT